MWEASVLLAVTSPTVTEIRSKVKREIAQADGDGPHPVTHVLRRGGSIHASDGKFGGRAAVCAQRYPSGRYICRDSTTLH